MFLFSCSREYSREGITCDNHCLYFKMIKVAIDFNGHYVYNADFYCAKDTNIEVIQVGIWNKDTNYYLPLRGTIMCGYKVDSLNRLIP